MRSRATTDLTLALGDLAACAIRETAWVDPVEVASAFADEAYTAVLLSTEDDWSYVLRHPDRVEARGNPEDLMDDAATLPDGPPFQGGVLGLAAYEFSAQLEPTAPQTRSDWPDLTLMRYPALLAFHAGQRRGVTIGRGPNAVTAAAMADFALTWLKAPRTLSPSGQLAETLTARTLDGDHALAVAQTVEKITAGDLFQANLARPWAGRLVPGAHPYDLFRRLAAKSPAAYAAYLRLPGHALVSNSPERFLSVRRAGALLSVQTDPVKGTRPRSPDPALDRTLALDLAASVKDQAENLMIVDLMRNDLSRVCRPGSVRVPIRAELRSYANVHHLVSVVRGALRAGVTAWDAFLAAFPPGSVTGAPKLAAMAVIASHETPRGPYCGSLFWLGVDGTLEASVLIRTVALTKSKAGWAFEARAGGGIVADSDPDAEVAETSAKISAILQALMEVS